MIFIRKQAEGFLLFLFNLQMKVKKDGQMSSDNVAFWRWKVKQHSNKKCFTHSGHGVFPQMFI